MQIPTCPRHLQRCACATVTSAEARLCHSDIRGTRTRPHKNKYKLPRDSNTYKKGSVCITDDHLTRSRSRWNRTPCPAVRAAAKPGKYTRKKGGGSRKVQCVGFCCKQAPGGAAGRPPQEGRAWEVGLGTCQGMAPSSPHWGATCPPGVCRKRGVLSSD